MRIPRFAWHPWLQSATSARSWAPVIWHKNSRTKSCSPSPTTSAKKMLMLRPADWLSKPCSTVSLTLQPTSKHKKNVILSWWKFLMKLLLRVTFQSERLQCSAWLRLVVRSITWLAATSTDFAKSPAMLPSQIKPRWAHKALNSGPPLQRSRFLVKKRGDSCSTLCRRTRTFYWHSYLSALAMSRSMTRMTLKKNGVSTWLQGVALSNLACYLKTMSYLLL